MPPSRSHKPITYGKSSREKFQQFTTNDAPRSSRLRSKSNEQQGNSAWLNNLDPREESKELKAIDNQDTSAEQPNPLPKHSGQLRSSMGDEKEKDTHTTERKRRKFGSDSKGPQNYKTEAHGSSRHSMKVADSLSANKSETSNNAQPGSEDLPNNERRHIRHASENTTPQKKTGARKKLVNSLGSADSANKKLPVSGEDDDESSSFQSPSNSTRVQRSTTPTRNPISQSDKLNLKEYGLDDSAALSPSSLRASKVTYGRQRSFLNEAPIPGRIDNQDDSGQQSQRQFGSESISHVDFQVDDDMGDSNGPVRSIHELRQAGDNARFRGAIDGIFEEIASSHDSKFTCCNGFIQLTLRLFDRRVSRRFSENGFVGKFVDCLSKDLDVLSVSFAFCSYELIRASGVLSPTDFAIVWPKLLDLSHVLLASEADDICDLIKRQEFGISKTLQDSVKKAIPMLCATISDNPPLSNLTPHLIALRCICSCIRGLQHNGDTIESMHIPILNQLVDMLVLKNPGALMSPEDFLVVFWILSILEAYMALADSLADDHRDTLRPIAQLYHILEMEESELNDRSREIRILYIKVILNLTNNNSSFWTEFVKPELLGALLGVSLPKFSELTNEHLVEEKSALDTIILALGTLINLTQRSDMARVMFLTTTKNSRSFLQILLGEFSAVNIDLVTEAKSVHDTHYNVIVGYLSVLLTALCLNSDAYLQVTRSLGEKGLRQVLSIAEEFQQYHQRVEQDLHESGRGTNSSFTGELQDIIQKVRQLGDSL